MNEATYAKSKTSYLHKKLCSVGGVDLFLKCNFELSKHDLKLNPFYEEIFNYWRDFKTNFHILQDSNEIIWNNKDFLIGNKTVFMKDFYDIGIVQIQDLFRTTSLLEDFTYWVGKGLEKNLCNYMRFISLRSAILKARPLVKYNVNYPVENQLNDLSVVNENSGQVVPISSFKSKQFYTFLEKDRKAHPTYASKLKEDFRICDEELKKYYFLPFKISIEPKIREFQYKQLNFILNTNLLLKRKNIVTSEKCEFCHIENETIYHLFYNCFVVKKFWSKVADFWTNRTNMTMELSKSDVILGNLQFCDILNYIIFLGKFYIFTAHNAKILPQFNEFLVLLKEKYAMEESVGRKNKTIIKFRKRWAPLCGSLSGIGE